MPLGVSFVFGVYISCASASRNRGRLPVSHPLLCAFTASCHPPHAPRVNRETKETQWIDPRIDVVRQQLREREQSSPQNTGVVMDNVTCALCLELYYQPGSSPCAVTGMGCPVLQTETRQ